jgi:hypothetical protein
MTYRTVAPRARGARAARAYNFIQTYEAHGYRCPTAIEERDTKIEKKLAKIKIDFFDFLGSAVLGGAVFFFF